MSFWSRRNPLGDERERKPAREMARESAQMGEIIESGDFEIDLAQRTATLRGQELQLTSEEFDVLVFLARHPKRLVTPHTMLATNWSANGPRQTAFLRCLLSLRDKLEAAGGGRHYLRTEPWVVYRFESALPSASETAEQPTENTCQKELHQAS